MSAVPGIVLFRLSGLGGPTAELAGWRFDDGRFPGNGLAPLSGIIMALREMHKLALFGTNGWRSLR